MKRINFFFLILLLLIPTDLYGKSLKGVPTEQLLDYLAELNIAAVHCHEYYLRDPMIDYIWDIAELKSKDAFSRKRLDQIFSALLDRWDIEFKKDTKGLCESAFSHFGRTGTKLPDMLYPRG